MFDGVVLGAVRRIVHHDYLEPDSLRKPHEVLFHDVVGTGVGSAAVAEYDKHPGVGVGLAQMPVPTVLYVVADKLGGVVAGAYGKVSGVVRDIINAMWDNITGTAARGGYGRVYTVRDLIRYTIIQSDNTAYLNLTNRYGKQIFNDFNDKAGADYYLTDGFIFTPCTSRQLMKQYIHIYKLAKKNKRVKWLTELMQKTEFERQITAQLKDKYPVSHKYGSDRLQVCYHDCAICYADSPFVLVIMTQQVPENDESDKVFHRLAKQFDIVNEQLAF